jgi:hypothetical protein
MMRPTVPTFEQIWQTNISMLDGIKEYCQICLFVKYIWISQIKIHAHLNNIQLISLPLRPLTRLIVRKIRNKI